MGVIEEFCGLFNAMVSGTMKEDEFISALVQRGYDQIDAAEIARKARRKRIEDGAGGRNRTGSSSVWKTEALPLSYARGLRETEMIYTANDFRDVSKGWIDNRMLQNWRASKKWLTPTPPALDRRSYPHSYSHLVEGALVHMMRVMSHRAARSAITNRMTLAQVPLVDLEEVRSDGNYFWLIKSGTEHVSLLRGPEKISSMMRGCDAASVFDVGNMMRRVRQKRAEKRD